MRQQDAINTFHEITTSTIYLMGGSFLLGGLFTLLCFVLMDLTRALQEKHGKSAEKDKEEDEGASL